MKKICINVPETKKEAIDLLVKTTVSNDDIDSWLAHSKKDYTLKRLKLFQEFIAESETAVNFISPAEFDEVALQVEKQVLELILGFEE